MCVVIALSGLALSCGSRDGKADKGRTAAVARVVSEPTELEADLAASSVSLAVVGGLDADSTVRGAFALRRGKLTLSNASMPAARFTVDLTSFDSHLPVRNDRVKQHFFEIAGAGGETAEVVVERLPEEALAKLRARKLVSGAKAEAELTLHGRTSKVSLTLDAGYTERGALWIKTTVPAALDIAALGLGENKKRLMQVCQHEKIEDVVKVEVSLEFPGG